MSLTPGPFSRRLERWLWTGPVGHLIGGALDLFGAYAHYLKSRLRTRGARGSQ